MVSPGNPYYGIYRYQIGYQTPLVATFQSVIVKWWSPKECVQWLGFMHFDQKTMGSNPDQSK